MTFNVQIKVYDTPSYFFWSMLHHILKECSDDAVRRGPWPVAVCVNPSCPNVPLILYPARPILYIPGSVCRLEMYTAHVSTRQRITRMLTVLFPLQSHEHPTKVIYDIISNKCKTLSHAPERSSQTLDSNSFTEIPKPE
jgi:hypothetical protein